MDNEKEDDDAVGDDTDEFTKGEEAREVIQPRWPTRVFAAECLRKIIQGIKFNLNLHSSKLISVFCS